jgi:hypothetical protein
MSEAKMLEEKICYCTSCKLELNHRIVLLNEDKLPERVLCLTCNKEHKYKKTPKSRLAKKATGTASASQISKARQSTEEKQWQEKLKNPNVTPVSYNINQEFAIDDHLQHSKFGKGLVIGFEYPDKVHVYFDDGVKILKGKKAEGSGVVLG